MCAEWFGMPLLSIGCEKQQLAVVCLRMGAPCRDDGMTSGTSRHWGALSATMFQRFPAGKKDTRC